MVSRSLCLCTVCHIIHPSWRDIAFQCSGLLFSSIHPVGRLFLRFLINLVLGSISIARYVYSHPCFCILGSPSSIARRQR
ncbi:hypothetical protein BDV32DRAFT_123401 [Aspergillus pseudonomiae]|nr:hypothetical protein BDV32DRAFT_123401 [Aspergillus pseudonomiae]